MDLSHKIEKIVLGINNNVYENIIVTFHFIF